MYATILRSIISLGALTLIFADPAAAHHPMGGKTPSTFVEGILSGFGHPIIGLDHLAAIVAVGCLAALHARGLWLVVGYVAAIAVGAAIHLRGVTVPAAEVLVALSVIGLGAVMILARPVAVGAAIALFAVTGLLHGYALGEAIVGAERTPLFAYFFGFAAVQIAIGLAAMFAMRMLTSQTIAGLALARAAGALVVCVGLASLVVQAFASA